jgi:hypothetical protein
MAFRGKSYQRIDKLHDAQADEYATAEALQEAAELATAAIAAAVQIPSIGNREIAMLPHMGQGANQAIEDGMALATLMRGTDAADVTEVLLRYQARVWSDRRDRSIADRLDVHVTLVGRTPDLDLAFGAIRSSDGCERKTASVAHDVLH